MSVTARAVLRGLSALLFASFVTPMAANDEHTDLWTRISAPTEERIWLAVGDGLLIYKKMNLYGHSVEFSFDQKAGTVESNWFPEHKGEILLKLKVTTWGDSFRVDAWQRTGLIFTTDQQTDWSRSIERKVQELIESRVDVAR